MDRLQRLEVWKTAYAQGYADELCDIVVCYHHDTQGIPDKLWRSLTMYEGPSVKLSKAELDVLQCGARGMSTQQTAIKRGTQFTTVQRQRKTLFRKLGVGGMPEAVAVAMRIGHIS